MSVLDILYQCMRNILLDNLLHRKYFVTTCTTEFPLSSVDQNNNSIDKYMTLYHQKNFLQSLVYPVL